jgi:hypothetical protein
MGRHRNGYLRAAVVMAAAAAGMGATAAWAQGTGDAGNTLGAPGTAAQPRAPRPQPQAQPQPRPQPQFQQQQRPDRPRFENRTGGTGDAGTSYGAPGTLRGPPAPVQRDLDRAQRRGPDRGNVDRGNFDRGNFDRPRTPGGAPAFAPDRPRPDFDRGPGRGPDRDGPRNWNGPGRDFPRGPDRRPDFRPDYPRADFRPDYRPGYRPPPRFHGGSGAGFYAWPPGYSYRPGPPPRRSDYYVYVDRRPYLVPPPRIRYYRDYPIVRPYGVWYQGYGRYRSDADAFRWLGLTAITLGVLDLLDEGQQRTLEDAQIQATEVPVGTRLDWDDRGARGSVQVLGEGQDEAGRYCRDFEQTVTVAGRTERAGGTACRDAEGVWEVIAPS